MKMNIIATLIVLSGLVMPIVTQAQITTGIYDSQLQAGGVGAGLTTTSSAANPTDPRVLAAEIIGFILKLLGTLFVALIITGGFRLIKSDGDSSKIDQAKETIEKAAVGLVIILMAYSITTFVGNRVNESIKKASPQTGFSSEQ